MKQLKKWTNINPEGVKVVRAQQYKRILRLAGISLPQEGVSAGFLEDALQRAQRDLAARAEQGSDKESDAPDASAPTSYQHAPEHSSSHAQGSRRSISEDLSEATAVIAWASRTIATGISAWLLGVWHV
ncbi:hypothetical protein BC835DRAFT_1305744 [Cytidiella melzeri]|nr:hypothetical protein BC835DRAFT_1305744 [Cytidiella melzeri]